MTTPHQEDNIIKNPNRNKDIFPNDYTPEYKRLGITPILKDFPTLDGEVIDSQLTTEANIIESHILDNNEEVSYGFEAKKPKIKNTSSSPDVGEFVLMVTGRVVSHGSHDQILAEAKAILYKEHPDFVDKKIQLDDLIILKRIGLKIGVFLDE